MLYDGHGAGNGGLPTPPARQPASGARPTRPASRSQRTSSALPGASASFKCACSGFSVSKCWPTSEHTGTRGNAILIKDENDEEDGAAEEGPAGEEKGPEQEESAEEEKQAEGGEEETKDVDLKFFEEYRAMRKRKRDLKRKKGLKGERANSDQGINDPTGILRS